MTETGNRWTAARYPYSTEDDVILIAGDGAEQGYRTSEKTKAPYIAEPARRGGFSALTLCPYGCAAGVHYHGADADGNGDGHRVEHCTANVYGIVFGTRVPGGDVSRKSAMLQHIGNSTSLTAGYVLRPATESEAELIRKLARDRQKGRYSSNHWTITTGGAIRRRIEAVLDAARIDKLLEKRQRGRAAASEPWQLYSPLNRCGRTTAPYGAMLDLVVEKRGWDAVPAGRAANNSARREKADGMRPANGPPEPA